MPCGSRVVFNCCSILMSMPAAQGQEGRPHRGNESGRRAKLPSMPERQTNREGARSCRHLPDSRRLAVRNRQSRAGCSGDRARPRSPAPAAQETCAGPSGRACCARMRGDARVVPAPRPRVRHAAARTARRPPRPGLSRDFPGQRRQGIRPPASPPASAATGTPTIHMAVPSRLLYGEMVPGGDTSPTCTRPTTRLPPRRASTASARSTPIVAAQPLAGARTEEEEARTPPVAPPRAHPSGDGPQGAEPQPHRPGLRHA